MPVLDPMPLVFQSLPLGIRLREHGVILLFSLAASGTARF
jgi:hypothetical protein